MGGILASISSQRLEGLRAWRRSGPAAFGIVEPTAEETALAEARATSNAVSAYCRGDERAGRERRTTKNAHRRT